MTADPTSDQPKTRRPSRDLPLLVDAGVDLVLGVLLMVFPRGLMRALGVPIPSTRFYPSLLGAVLIGVGISLVIERFRRTLGVAGLGLAGAVIINFLGSATLIWWLVNGHLRLPLQGYVLLWLLAIGVAAIGIMEILLQFRE